MVQNSRNESGTVGYIGYTVVYIVGYISIRGRMVGYIGIYSSASATIYNVLCIQCISRLRSTSSFIVFDTRVYYIIH